MSLRARLFIMISLLVLFVLGVVLFLTVLAKKKAATEEALKNETASQTSVPSTPSAPVPVKPVLPTALEVEQNAVKQLAKVFVERYSTYSTDNNFQNIREVQELVTAPLWKKLSARLGSGSTSPFYMVITSRAYGVSLSDWQADAATVNVQIRKSTMKNGATTSANETIVVTMVKQDKAWLVDNFVTQK